MHPSGLLIVHKPHGLSSRDCVNHVQRVMADKRLKIGHAGTLDPIATGVLILAIGQATRLVEQLHLLDKRYQAGFEFGKSSDTLDRDGNVVVDDHAAAVERAELEAACQRWVGPSVMQRPPRYSAIKIQGERAYDLARKGAEFEPEARPVAIYSLSLTCFEYPRWSLNIHCGSGTYVRSLGRDIAAQLGTTAIMNELVRTAIGPFSLQSSIPLATLVHRDDVLSRLRSPVEGLTGWRPAVVDSQQVMALRQGQKITLRINQFSRDLIGDRTYAVDSSGQLVALLEVAPSGYARPARVFQTTMATSQPNITSARHRPES